MQDRTTSTSARGLLSSSRIQAGAALLVICALYLFTIFRCARTDFDFDEGYYLILSRKIIEFGCPMSFEGKTNFVFASNPPLIMYATALIRFLGAESLFWLRFWHVTLFVLPCFIAVYFLASKMFNRPVGLVSLICLFTQPYFFIEASRVKLDVPVATFCTLSLLALYGLSTQPAGVIKRWKMVLIALPVGLAFLAKYQGVLVLFASLAFLFRWRKTLTRASYFSYTGALVTGAMASGFIWLLIASFCGDNFMDEFLLNVSRIQSKGDEPWFHTPIFAFWSELAGRLGPVLMGGFFLSMMIHGKRIFTQKNVWLLTSWVFVVFLFCSIIGLKSPRYFLSATPAIAILTASLVSPNAWEFLGRSMSRLRWIGPILLAFIVCSYAGYQTLRSVVRNARIHLTLRHQTIGNAVKQITRKEDRLLLSLTATAYYAERDCQFSQYVSSAEKWIAKVSDPRNNLTFYLEDSPNMFHPNMSSEDRQKIQEYLRRHFRIVPGPVKMYRRIDW
jgi:4-amino-4-deoxy-L-arabinose transferase-like glycosyltransferase